jgi:hypothetical protein
VVITGETADEFFSRCRLDVPNLGVPVSKTVVIGRQRRMNATQERRMTAKRWL